MNEIFYIDLQKTVLLGFQRMPFGANGELIPAVDDLVIVEIIKGIQTGADFQPIIVEHEVQHAGEYQISFYYNHTLGHYEGGHHRAIAHYIEGVPLRCRLRKDSDPIVWPVPTPILYPISQSLIIDDAIWAKRGLGLERRRELWKKES